MSSKTDTATATATAEQRFREAFLRLKNNTPEILHKDAKVSQNNVAKEAGCDPSALRKARYPSLIREIKVYVEINAQHTESKRSQILQARSKRSTLKERLAAVITQRDILQSQYISARLRAEELAIELDSIKEEFAKHVATLNLL